MEPADRRNDRAPGGVIRCVIVDRSIVLSAGLRLVLQGEESVDVVGTVQSRAELAALLGHQEVDVVVIGLEPLAEAIFVARQSDPIPALILSSSQSRSDLMAVLRANVSGLLPKDTSVEELVDALRLVGSGGRALPQAWEGELVNWLDGAKRLNRSDIGPLTTREQQIVQLVVQGHSNKQVARMLGIAPQTVKNHLYSIMKKLQVESRTELVMLALDGTFVQRPDPPA